LNQPIFDHSKEHAMNRCAHCFGDLPEFAVFCPHCARADQPDFEQLLNQTVTGRYRLYKRLGQGGLSTVFAATDLETDHVVVVKVSDPAQLIQRELSYAIDAEAARNYWHEMLERMRLEAETLAAIQHPNIVRFYGTGLLGEDLRYVVMEFLHGHTLREELGARGRLDSAEAVRIALGICAALSEVHARGIVHRDINPRNVMLEAETKLIDFGIAKFPQPPGAPPFTQHSVLSGTVAYASPEQCQSRAMDGRSDIYSLGVMLYEMITGERPFTGRTPTEIALKQIQAEPTPPRQLNPDIPASLERTVLRMLAKNPDERPQNIEELTDELRYGARQVFVPLQTAEETDQDEVESSPEDDFDRLMLVRRRRRRVAVAAAAIMLIAAAAGLLLGKNGLASRFAGLSSSDIANVTPSPSASPAISGTTASDADSLELAAQLPLDRTPNSAAGAYSSGSGNKNSSSQGNASANQPMAKSLPTDSTSAPAKPSPSPALATRSAARSATPRQVAAKTHSHPTPSPTVAAPRAPQANNPPKQTEVAQALPKTEGNPSKPREDNPVAENASNTPPNPEPPPVSRRDRIANNRNDTFGRDRNETAGNSRRNPRGDNTDADNGPDLEHLGPKLIQWSGSVNREREVTIDLPGVPGTLEIPRVYRDRVGMVQPPSASNHWRTATVRVFGQGGVSFVVRWWPMSSHYSKVAERGN
jgi:serine/threonine protein kinase